MSFFSKLGGLFRHDGEQIVLSALEREIRNSGGWVSLGNLRGASETLHAPLPVPSPNDMSGLKYCVEWQPEGVELLGMSAKGLDDAQVCHVVCLMPLGRTIVERGHDSIRSLADDRFRGVVLHHPASRKKAFQFASKLDLLLSREINQSQAWGWSLDQEELRQLGLEVFNKPPD